VEILFKGGDFEGAGAGRGHLEEEIMKREWGAKLA
jgi:hypothetical protein